MTIDAELEDFFAADIQTVVADSDRFRRKLEIGGEAFALLTRAENTSSYVNALSGGAGAAGATYAAWWSSLGVLGKIGAGIGMVSTPVGWVGAAGAVGAGTFLLTHRLLRKMRQATTEEIPRFINTPLDVLGVSISEILAPVLCKIVLADGEVADQEISRVESYLCDEWGYDEKYVKSLLVFDAKHVADWDWSQLGEAIAGLRSTKDVKVSGFARELVRIAEDVAESDGRVTQSERVQLARLRDAVGVDTPRSLWTRVREAIRRCIQYIRGFLRLA
ncbi:TerB family tellurite resistance protein [Chromatocurvus halotolerans]|uniref:Tellurite resistance protein n=1 Tax=Chromatocurvus halotolerans TaxID=1132028 RepID=A0A4R2KU42_9GAMM|nr:TerB family tellurite resistance protein [Chromatocurvus halotolerans]TCO73698.1 tellurite resistance protein [Chromatocurvus halotolerans]